MTEWHSEIKWKAHIPPAALLLVSTSNTYRYNQIPTNSDIKNVCNAHKNIVTQDSDSRTQIEVMECMAF